MHEFTTLAELILSGRAANYALGPYSCSLTTLIDTDVMALVARTGLQPAPP